MTIHLERCFELSMNYFIQAVFSGIAVSITDEFPEENIDIPVVSVDGQDYDIIPHEMGNRSGIKPRFWVFEVFGKNKTQRNDIMYRISDALELQSIPVYEFTEDKITPDAYPPQIGCLEAEDISVHFMKPIPDTVSKIKWRGSVTCTATYNRL